MADDLDIQTLLEKGTVSEHGLQSIRNELNERTANINPYTVPAETYIRTLGKHINGLNGSTPNPGEYRDLSLPEKRELVDDIITYLRWYAADEYGMDGYLDELAVETGLIPAT